MLEALERYHAAGRYGFTPPGHRATHGADPRALRVLGGDGGVLPGVRQVDPQRAGMIRPRRKVGLLGELIDFHDFFRSHAVIVREGARCSIQRFFRTCSAYSPLFWSLLDVPPSRSMTGRGFSIDYFPSTNFITFAANALG